MGIEEEWERMRGVAGEGVRSSNFVVFRFIVPRRPICGFSLSIARGARGQGA